MTVIAIEGCCIKVARALLTIGCCGIRLVRRMPVSSSDLGPVAIGGTCFLSVLSPLDVCIKDLVHEVHFNYLRDLYVWPHRRDKISRPAIYRTGNFTGVSRPVAGVGTN